jgi:hypothetical protein
MAKTKQTVIEIEFVASFSEQSESSDVQDNTDAETAGAREAARHHEDQVARYIELASRAQIAIRRHNRRALQRKLSGRDS